MKHVMRAVTVFRRLIIVIFGILLIPQAMNLIPSDYGDKAIIKDLQEDGPVTTYVIDKKMDMDGDVFTVEDIYITPKQVVLQYSIKKQDRNGWSFPNTALTLIDSNGEELISHGGGSSVRAWGENGIMFFDKMKDPNGDLIIKYKWYDREALLNISLP
ncbi:hypothetical protein PMSD_09565 [Paenibacillus macquariensis subsp. defensor]|nr:hypothetical protein PMSD_09565 [Paenibacillus macquariensis subsp. defensor]